VGLEEAGRLAAGADKSESAKARRKRKAAETAAAGGASKSARAAAAAEQRTGWANAKAQRRAFSDAWLALLQLPIPADICRKVLLRLHSSVIPNMASPLMLSDFLTYSLNQGELRVGAGTAFMRVFGANVL
jgi:U3 small nucleolar RNA-associated protein 19